MVTVDEPSETSTPAPIAAPGRKRGRPRRGEVRPPAKESPIRHQRKQTLAQMMAEIPTACDRGTKCNAQGYKISWNGYKLHLDTADCGVPIPAMLSSASMHDSRAAIPLSLISTRRVTCLYDVMDAAYCSTELHEHFRSLDHMPLIDHNPRGDAKDEFEPADADGVRPGLKESGRWIEGYGRVAEMATDMPGTRLVYVADREADMIELMKYAQDCGTPADWLVRAKTNRALPDGEKLWAHTLNGEPLGEISFTVGAREKQKSRKVRQQLWAKRVELPAGRGVKVAATCLIAREIDAPAGVEPIEWRLLTNRSATTSDEVIELINWYRARWDIEIFFHVLKKRVQGRGDAAVPHRQY